jgi:hypothetical protein
MSQDREKKLIVALATRANEVLAATGRISLPVDEIYAIAHDLGLYEREEALRVLRKLDERGLIGLEPGECTVMGLAALYEERIDRALFHRRNRLRRELITLSAEAEDHGDQPKIRHGAAEGIDRSWSALIVALRYLNWEGLVWLDEAEDQQLSWQLTEEGYELAENDSRLRSRLPTNADEDDYVDL